MTKPNKIERVLKDHQEEESAVWKIGLCGVRNGSAVVLGIIRLWSAQQGHTDGPLMNRWTARRRKQRRCSRMWMLHDLEAVIRNNRGMDI